jgi:hypothetical protein
MTSPAYSARDVTLLDLADRLLQKGAVLGGDLVLSIADVDLVYVSLRALVASVDTAMSLGVSPPGVDG